MLLEPYSFADTRFAFCYRVYLRCQTHRRIPCPELATLSTCDMAALAAAYGIRVLESSADATGLMLLVSLRPEETVAACAGKLKGKITKSVREMSGDGQAVRIFSRGYFANTSGKSTQDSVIAYLDTQPKHHGYAQRTLPPVYIEEFELTAREESRLVPEHACACLRFHVVLASWQRRGIFGSASAPVVARRWRNLVAAEHASLLKVSFVADHGHIALGLHPRTAPGGVVVKLMNAAQETMQERFGEHLIEGGLERLWQPSAYLGSYGNISSKAVKAYIRAL